MRVGQTDAALHFAILRLVREWLLETDKARDPACIFFVVERNVCINLKKCDLVHRTLVIYHWLNSPKHLNVPKLPFTFAILRLVREWLLETDKARVFLQFLMLCSHMHTHVLIKLYSLHLAILNTQFRIYNITCIHMCC